MRKLASVYVCSYIQNICMCTVFLLQLYDIIIVITSCIMIMNIQPADRSVNYER